MLENDLRCHLRLVLGFVSSCAVAVQSCINCGVVSLRLWRCGVCVITALQRGFASESWSEWSSRGPAVHHALLTTLERKTARHHDQWDEKHTRQVSTRSRKVKTCQNLHSKKLLENRNLIGVLSNTGSVLWLWSKNNYQNCVFCSGEEMLQHKHVSFEMLASVFPEMFAPYLEFSQRIKIEGEYFNTR